MSRTLHGVRGLGLLIVVGCSQPAHHPIKPPPDPDATPDVARPYVFRYDWEKRRAQYAKRTAGVWPDSPCVRHRMQPPTEANGFFYPAGPTDMAASVVTYELEDGRTVLWLDRGPTDGVDDTWSGVLLDNSGHALHEWTCVELSRTRGAMLHVELPLEQAKRYRHVALFQNPPPLKP
jgi:hypothetical protein